MLKNIFLNLAIFAMLFGGVSLNFLDSYAEEDFSIPISPIERGLSASKHVSVYEKGIPLYYWEERIWQDFTNFGDSLSEKIVERIVGHRIATTFNNSLSKKYGKRKLLALGSIVHMAENNDVIWGSGINGKHPDKTDKRFYRFAQLDVRAVRGPLTRQFLMDMGISCPEVYGDPALLLPRLFPEFVKSENPSKEYVIIPHYSDEHLFAKHPNLLTVKEDWDEMIRQVLDSKFVISTSLHGIIVAEAFGIPARYLKVSDKEPLFKYADYYLGTNRHDFKYATTVEEALRMGGEPLPECDLDKLLQSFPFDLYPQAANSILK